MLVCGPASVVDDPGEAEALRNAVPLRPWAGGARGLPVRITPTSVGGRRAESGRLLR